MATAARRPIVVVTGASAGVDRATHRRRELYVGWPTVRAIWGDKIAPGLLDRYLARTGYDAQQSDEPTSADRADNLWAPVPGDHGAHGRFDECSRRHSWQLWLTTHRWLKLVALTGATAAGWSMRRGNAAAA